MKLLSLIPRIFVALLVMLPGLVNAQSAASDHNATIRGKSEVLITKSRIVISDIAEVSAQNAEAQISLSRIDLGISPKPGRSLELPAQKILEALQTQGVDLKRVGYILAPITKIRRASRALTETEVEAALQSSIASKKDDLVLTKVQLPRDAQIFTGPVTMRASLRNDGNGANSSQRIYQLTLTSAEGENLTLEGRAEIDAWRQVPVASRSLSPGSILESLDFGLARLNMKDLPKDVALGRDELLGKKIQREVGVGQVFRVSTLQRPPLIKSGTRVVLLVRSGALEATASGTALQDGFGGDLIEVRNDNSRRIVQGQVKDQSTVEVLQ